MTVNGDRESADTEFIAKLGRCLLDSYAAGVTVEGKWTFVDTDEVVPDFAVVVRRVDDRGDGLRSGPDVTFETRTVEQFKTELYDLLLREFASGNTVAESWHVRFAASELPEWTVRIELDGNSPITDCLRGTF